MTLQIVSKQQQEQVFRARPVSASVEKLVETPLQVVHASPSWLMVVRQPDWTLASLPHLPEEQSASLQEVSKAALVCTTQDLQCRRRRHACRH